jgi:hypothetical protein
VLGKLFHPLEFLHHILRKQAPVYAFYVSMDGGRKFGEFLGIVLEPHHIHSGSLLGV